MKKRIIPFILMLSLILTPAFAQQMAAEVYGSVLQTSTQPANQVRVQVDGQMIEFEDQEPIIVDGRTLVPVRGVFEFMGFDVDWNPTSRQATLTSEDYEVILTIGSAEFTTNGIVHMLDVPAQIINDRTMLPIRAVLESVGYYVSWDSRLRTVLVSSEPITYITIQGEQFSSALRQLQILDMNLTNEDIVKIAQLPNLTWLNLVNGQEITDIAPLSTLTNLEVLSVSLTQVKDITPLTNLTYLRSLHLSDDTITDLTPLSSLTRLESLSLSGRGIRDITVLSELTQLEFLRLTVHEVRDIKPLESLTNLTYLQISLGMDIEDISVLANLVNLTELTLASPAVGDITPLANLTALETLILSSREFLDLAALSGLTDLTWLSISGPVTDLTPLANLTNLTFLGLFVTNEINDITPIASLTNLTELFLALRGDEPIDIAPLSRLINLYRLHLSGDQISNLSPISELVNLRFLHLSSHNITDITPLSTLKNLEHLTLRRSQVVDTTPLNDLPNLTHLEVESF